MIPWIGLAAALLASAPVASQAEPAGGRVTRPDWAVKPTDQQVHGALSPENAAGDGWAIMKCQVTDKRKLAHCRTIVEGPEDRGFGKSALKLAPLFKLKPETREGKPVDGGTILVPIAFGPRQTYMPANTTLALKPVSGPLRSGTILCRPYDQTRVCTAEPIAWTEAPTLEAFAPIVLTARSASGVMTIYCPVGDLKPKDTCSALVGDGEVRGALTPINWTLSHLKGPRGLDGKPTTTKEIVMVYDWTTLIRVAEAVAGADDSLDPQ